ncbi:hypothetical protein BKA65DRAFT_513751 [Rhexocercosporidium sp. MPI-PUGE-AT-0058]|nr:hypothetical protein BKA65DRAFT_513751 [Rhexocercosporidium sp. MPI-PUGE-AT-0058]
MLSLVAVVKRAFLSWYFISNLFSRTPASFDQDIWASLMTIHLFSFSSCVCIASSSSPPAGVSLLCCQNKGSCAVFLRHLVEQTKRF